MTEGSMSNVGTAGVYEAKDQQAPEQPKTVNPNPEYQQSDKPDIHDPKDPKDERSIANRIEAEAEHGQSTENDAQQSAEDAAAKIDATLPAKMHGNEPSKGAKIDQQLREEEEAELAKKGNFGPAAAN